MCRRPSASGQRLSEVIFPKDFQSDNPDRDYILDMIPMALAQEHHHPVVKDGASIGCVALEDAAKVPYIST
jgi:hypothetical protein